MAASPSRGERPQMQGAFRRSFTVPARQLSLHEKAGLDKSDAGADILYTHPSARIISFSPPTDSIKSNNKAEIPADTDYPVDTIETLPWRSRSETLAAAGAMVIEKVRGSTNFLKCQDVMHAILRNSQCWCVDGESKFVLRVRSFKYYRIELPSTTEEDKAKVEELKKVLPTVLRYERTPCPFIRAFTVDLPDDAITPRRKGQWKRRDSSQSNTPDTETSSLRRTKVARSWSARNPPTSYPKSGPGSLFDSERGRTRDASPLYRRASLFESSRNSSPASYAPSDEGTDSEHQGSEHNSELGDPVDRSASTSPQKGSRSKLAEVTSRPQVGSAPDAAVVTASNLETYEKFDGSEVNPNVDAKILKALNTELLDDAARQEVVGRSSEQGKADESIVNNEVPLIASREAKNVASLYDGAESEDPHIAEPQATNRQPGEVSSNDMISKTGVATESSSTDELDSGSSESSEEDSRAERGPGPMMRQLVGDIETGRTGQTSAQSEDFESENANAHMLGEPSSPGLQAKANPDFMVKVEQQERLTRSRELQPSPLLDLEDEPDLALRERDHNSVVRRAGADPTTGGVSVREKRQHPVLPNSADDETKQFELPIETMSDNDAHEDDDVLSTVSSVDSFHTMASPKYELSQKDLDMTRSSASMHHNLSLPMTSQHKRDLSEVTVVASSASDPASPGREPGMTQGEDQEQTLSMTAQGHEGFRQRSNHQRSFSPLPPPSTIFLGSQIRHDSGSGHMTKAILQKVIIKPIEAAIFVVHILARIAGGATVSDLMSGDLFKRPQHTRRISGFADQPNGSTDASDTEDDFGVPVRGRRRSTEQRLAMVFDDDQDQHSEGVD